MICLNCAVYLEIKRNTKKFCSDKCRVYYSRKRVVADITKNKTIQNVPSSVTSVPDWAKNIFKKEEPVENKVEEEYTLIQDDTL